jgi:hypothetical protein
MSDKSKVNLLGALRSKQEQAIRTLDSVPEYARGKVEKNIRKRARKIERLIKEIDEPNNS